MNRFADRLSLPASLLFVLNVAMPYLASPILQSVSHSPQRAVYYWLFVVILFTFNQQAARKWPQHKWWFWIVSALNIVIATPMGFTAFATALPELPSTIWWISYYVLN